MTNHELQSSEFYRVRYSGALRQLQDAVFSEVYDDYFGQSSWITTADYDRFFSMLRQHGKLNLTLLKVKYSVRLVSLREYAPLACRVVSNGFSRLGFGNEGFEIESPGLLACHDTPHSGLSG